MKPKRFRIKRWLTWISLGVVFMLLAAVFAACRFPQQILTVDSGPVKADALVVLGGGMTVRSQRATELFKAGEALLIVCTGYGDGDANEAYLTNSGVPRTAILLEANSRSTAQNAQFTIAMLHERHIKSAIIVTSWFHSRRALACFEHYAPDIKFYSRPSYVGYVGRSEDGGRTADVGDQTAARKAQNGYVKAEYEKLLGYWVCYGICPL